MKRHRTDDDHQKARRHRVLSGLGRPLGRPRGEYRTTPREAPIALTASPPQLDRLDRALLAFRDATRATPAATTGPSTPLSPGVYASETYRSRAAMGGMRVAGGAGAVQTKRAAGVERAGEDDDLRAGGPRGRESAARERAEQGISGSGGSLPYLDAIQRSFGAHDVSGVKAHVGGAASEASASIGAKAYATGSDVAFAGAPDLHTAAHEAAHVVQQRGGVQLKGGVGVAGDRYERHADAVADAVVRGESAEALLDEFSSQVGPRTASMGAVQRKPDPRAGAKVREGVDDEEAKKEAGVDYTSDAEFFDKLGSSESQRRVLAALQRNPEFKELWDWFVNFPGGNPIRLMVKPNLTRAKDGLEVFGSFSQKHRVLVINPTKREHLENPQEMVDTIVHELIHAALFVHHHCLERDIPIPKLPFAREINDLVYDTRPRELGIDPRRPNEKSAHQGHPESLAYMDRNYGPAASNPEDEYLDVNADAQRMIIRIIKDNLAKTGVGKETLTSINEAARQLQAMQKRTVRLAAAQAGVTAGLQGAAPGGAAEEAP